MEELSAFERYIKEKSLKHTEQRFLILKKIFSRHRHFTADELLGWLKKEHKHISRATVYRMLNLLVRANLLESQDFGKGRAYYEHRIGHNHHDHIVCVGCGKIQEFENDTIEGLQNRITKEVRFVPISHTLKIYGFCNRCR